MTFQDCLIVGLSSFIITFFLVEDFDGPFSILKKMRDWATDMWVIEGDEEYIHKFLGPVFKCHWCMGTWISIICSVVYVIVFGLPAVSIPFLWLASMAIAGIVHEVVMKL